MRQKSIAVGAMEAVQAVEEMEMLDHDFYLFREVDPTSTRSSTTATTAVSA